MPYDLEDECAAGQRRLADQTVRYGRTMGCYGAGLAAVSQVENLPSRPAKPYRYPTDINEMRIILLTITLFATQANAQLISPNGDPPLNRILVEIASDVPQKLQGDASLTFGDLDIYFDGGSHGAEFQRNDGGKLMLFFPHSGYWTPAARKKRAQPVAVLTRRNGKQILVEIKPDSKLNRRIVDLIEADVSSGRHSPENVATLKRIGDSVRKRSPLKEIADRMDAKTGKLKLDDAPFGSGDGNPFD